MVRSSAFVFIEDEPNSFPWVLFFCPFEEWLVPSVLCNSAEERQWGPDYALRQGDGQALQAPVLQGRGRGEPVSSLKPGQAAWEESRSLYSRVPHPPLGLVRRRQLETEAQLGLECCAGCERSSGPQGRCTRVRIPVPSPA